MSSEHTSVLICDDSLLMRKKLKDLLIGVGCSEVLEASNGQEAIDLYRIYHPHVVFMDIIMPVKTGIEATKEIKRLDEKANIIIVSSIGTKNKLKEAIEVGATDFLQKPIQKENVVSVFKHAVQAK